MLKKTFETLTVVEKPGPSMFEFSDGTIIRTNADNKIIIDQHKEMVIFKLNELDALLYVLNIYYDEYKATK